ncbi:PQQ-dependent sugar dehydrogenase [Methylonatrum kenyense]|uniref:PQQ-dependent sugar dehydrogenase n=1 Tax=Methylonatrum kenyense TaxID=455253 RepID=UPI0020BF1A7A|nr:PQQ-dependent sugar dehydrogenase [Methylonatrum kenyense]MCK8516212.1 PQQ-dependent sugar dehydrogenase [Methylonatrum kenyense]
MYRCIPAMIVLLGVAGLAIAETRYQSEQHEFIVETLRDDLRHPWGLSFLPDGDMLVTERGGRLLRISADGSESTAVAGVPDVHVANQAGLLDVALHPDFDDNQLVYLSYSSPDGQAARTALGRGRLDGDRLQDFEEIFAASPALGGGRHLGSRIVFDEDGTLFLSVGDRGQRDMAQDPADHVGTVLRLNEDGSVPEDNPFVGDSERRPEIFSYGHRNPQGMIRHPDSGEIWINEHGPRGGDELNRLQAGLNYGWPEVTLGTEYSGPSIGVEEKEGMEPPVYHWTPSIAPSGMAYYDGEAFPEWRGNLFVGALAHTHLARLTMDGDQVVSEERLLDDAGWRIRDVRQGPDGALYLLVDARDGRLVRLSPADSDS